MDDGRWHMCETVFGVMVGVCLTFTCLDGCDYEYRDGVIDATRGRATARLVEKPDGTNEWKVERVTPAARAEAEQGTREGKE